MITFITSIFENPTIIQENALFSWTLKNIPIVIAGKVSTIEKIKNRFPALTASPHVKTEKDLGFNGDAPVVKDMIKKALPYVQTPLLAIINSDVLIRWDFLSTLEKIITKYGPNIFLSGNRYDINYNIPIESEEALIEIWKKINGLHQDKSGDIFISTKENFNKMADEMPNFIMGRMVWDNWIHLYFSEKDIPCYNISTILPVLHMNHDYSHLQTSLEASPSVKHNCSIFRKANPEGKRRIIGIRSWFKPKI